MRCEVFLELNPWGHLEKTFLFYKLNIYEHLMQLFVFGINGLTSATGTVCISNVTISMIISM